MKRSRFAHPLLLLGALLVLPAYSTARLAGDDTEFRVYYVFDPADPAQVERAAAAHEATAAREQVEWIGIRTATMDPAPEWAPFQLADMLARRERLPAVVARWLEEGAAAGGVDHVLVEDAASHRTFAGNGADLARLTAASGLTSGVRTDVAVTTWGKVKELFR